MAQKDRLLDAFAALGTSLSERRMRRATERLQRAARFNPLNPRRAAIEGDAAADVEQAGLLADAAAECRRDAGR